MVTADLTTQQFFFLSGNETQIRPSENPII